MLEPRYIIIHHTGAEEENAEQVRKYHLSLGWTDVGYNYIIEKEGKLVKGRPLKIPGAHTKAGGMNRKSIGIALIGNFENHRPYPRQLFTLKELLNNLTQEYSIQVSNILGHREVPDANTVCPGKYFPLDEIRREISSVLFLLKFYLIK